MSLHRGEMMTENSTLVSVPAHAVATISFIVNSKEVAEHLAGMYIDCCRLVFRTIRRVVASIPLLALPAIHHKRDEQGDQRERTRAA